MLPVAASCAVSRVASRAASAPPAAVVAVAQATIPASAASTPASTLASTLAAAVPDAGAPDLGAPAAGSIETALLATASDLPPEIWGLVADLSSRHTVFNLRAVNKTVMQGVHETFTSFKIANGEQLRTFVHFGGFAALADLEVTGCDDTDLATLAAALTRNPSPSLNLTLVWQGTARTTPLGLGSLCAVPLGSLCLWNWKITSAAVDVLARFACPVKLKLGSRSGQDVDISRIPTLTTVDRWRGFDADTVRALNSHRSLTEVRLCSLSGHLSGAGIRLLPEIETLRTLDFAVSILHADDARALAISRIAKLTVQSSCANVGAAVVEALSRSRTLTHLALPLHAGVRHLGNLTTLEHLDLMQGMAGGREPALRLDMADASALRGLPRLRHLGIRDAQFDAGALTETLGGGCASLSLMNAAFEERTCQALLANPALTDLVLEDVQIPGPDAVALAGHPGLARLSINFSYRFGHIPQDRYRRAMVAAWIATGHPIEGLSGGYDTDFLYSSTGGADFV